jgi:hypothetical protein
VVLSIRVPDPAVRPRLAHRIALSDALAAARCAAKLARVRTDEVAVRELLRTVDAQITLALAAAARLS